MTILIRVFKDLYRYKWIYLLRGLLWQLFFSTIGQYLLSEVLYLMLILAKQDQLTQQNATKLLANPFSILGLLIYLLLLAALIYAEFAILVDIIRRKDRAIAWSGRRFLRRCQALLTTISGYHLFPFITYLLLTVPVVQWLLSSILLDNIRVPQFIIDELVKHPTTAGLLIGVSAMVYYVNLRLIYAMPLTIMRFETRFWDNVVQSWQLTKRQTHRLLVALGLLILPLFLLAGVSVLSAIFILELLGTSFLAKTIQWSLLTFIWGLSLSISTLSKLATMSYLLTKLDKGHLHLSYEALPKVSRHRRWLALTATFLLGLGQLALNYDRLAYNPYNKAVQTIAHRGDVSKGVENSLEALEAAARADVDYVEMDLILTKDDQFVVSHDNNLKRLTGQRRLISQSNLNEIVGLPISQDGNVSQLVAFDTYVAWAQKLGVKLMVELKPHGNEPADYAQKAIAVLRKLGVNRDYKLMSLDLELMLTIEELAPEIETGYIIPFQFGALAGEGLDFLLVEDFSYRKRLVWEAQWRNQELYVWTINSEEQVTRYLQSPVTGLITDDPDLVSGVKAELSREASLVDRILRLLD